MPQTFRESELADSGLYRRNRLLHYPELVGAPLWPTDWQYGGLPHAEIIELGTGCRWALFSWQAS